MAKTFPTNRPKVRPGSQVPRLPKVFWPANDNIPSKVATPLLRRAGSIGGRVIARSIPFVGFALTAYELYEMYEEYKKNPLRYASNGWRLCEAWTPPTCTTAFNLQGFSHSSFGCGGIGGTVNCSGSGQALSIIGVNATFNPNATALGKHIYYSPFNNGSYRGKQFQAYVRVNPAVKPTGLPGVYVSPPPDGMPWLPHHAVPAYVPNPIPGYMPRWSKPTPAEQPSNRPIPVTDFVAPNMPFPAYVTSPQEIYPYVPIQEIVIKPGGGGGGPPEKPRKPAVPGTVTLPGTGTQPKPPTPKPQPETQVSVNTRNPTREDVKDRTPKRREKERKVRSRAVGKLWAFVGQITEGMDLIEVLYDAIPEGKCGKFDWKTRTGDYFTDPYEKATAIYNCFEHINVGQALENYVNNQIEDWAYSLQGKALAGASKNLGVTTGLSRAITQNQEDDFVGYLVPKVDIDWTTGDISVTVKAINGKPKE